MAAKKRKRRKRSGNRAPRRQPASTPERELQEARRELQELFAPETPAEQVADVLVESFDERPAPPGIVLRLAADGPQRAREVVQAVTELAPDSVLALAMQAELALTVDEDRERADALIDAALDAEMAPEGYVLLARLLLLADRAMEALELVEPDMLEDPEDEPAQEVQALALERLHEREQAGETLSGAERAVLEQFSDRDALYELREALVAYVNELPELQGRIAETAGLWLGELGEELTETFVPLEVGGGGGNGDSDPDAHGDRDPGGGDDEDDDDDLAARADVLVRMAVEYAWILDGDEEEDAERPPERAAGHTHEWSPDEPEIGEPSSSILELFGSDPQTPQELSSAAGDWLASFTYGLWQITDPVGSPGVWLTNLASGVSHYTAVPSEQLEQLSPWSVLAGALIALDGIWRTTGTLIPLRPSEADIATEMVRRYTNDLARELTGKRRRPRRKRPEAIEPHGVLIEEVGPVPPEIADLMSQVLGLTLPSIATAIWDQREAGPMRSWASREAIDAWLTHWPDEHVPALGGLTPRTAAARAKQRPRLEALLREFEHDVYKLARAGEPAPDIARLRAELGMEVWWEPPGAPSP